MFKHNQNYMTNFDFVVEYQANYPPEVDDLLWINQSGKHKGKFVVVAVCEREYRLELKKLGRKVVVQSRHVLEVALDGG